VTDLPLPDTTVANLTISAELFNAGDKDQKGVLKGKIDLVTEVDFISYTKVMPGRMKSITFEKQVTIPAGQTIIVSIDTNDFPQLSINNPYLWWPNGYGEQYLHNLELTYEIEGKVSDRENTTFGIRKITNKLKELDGEFGRVFYINGKRVFCRGGWLQPEILLDMDKKRIYDEARLLALANVNMIANEDAPSPPDEIMESYDKYGLMVWETFYQCWRMYPGSETADNPLDHELALKNSYDIIKRYRNHPSLVVWCVACEVTVCSDLYIPLRKYVQELDPTRPFLATSSYDWDVDKLTPYMKNDLPLGMTDDGPPDYTWYPEPYYFEKVLEVKQQMFRNEMGVPSVPTLSSLKKFIPNLGENKDFEFFPLDRVWAHHGAWDDKGYVYKAYDKALRARYGAPTTAEDYSRKAQFVNGSSYRAMYEAANHRMWDITSGVMLWKLNSCWPTVVWQLYDWFLNPTAAYYYTRKALEPLHIQLNAHDQSVSIINTYHRAQEDMTVSVRLFDFDMNLRWQRKEMVTIGEDQYKEVFTVSQVPDLTPVYFVKLELKNERDKTVSTNFYWLSSKTPVDLTDLNKLPQVKLDLSYELVENEHEYTVHATVKNPTDKLGFFTHLILNKGPNGEEVLPTFWEDNFFSLLPGEEKTVKAIVAKADLDGSVPFIIVNNER
jgi:exo-1,4-beta-D-glucosaminidase